MGESIEQAFQELAETIVTYSQIFHGNWHLSSQVVPIPLISEAFDRNDGEALVHLTSYLNRSSLEISMQEGNYIDNRLLLTIDNIDNQIHGHFSIDDNTTESVYFINKTRANVTTFSDLRFYSTNECTFNIEMKITQNETMSKVLLRIEEVHDIFGETCLPNQKVHIIVEADTREAQIAVEFQAKTSHLSFIVTSLAIIATYFTVYELREVARSLEQRELVGQRENHAKRLSILTNAIICIWNMCYSITFFVTAMYFRVSAILIYDKL